MPVLINSSGSQYSMRILFLLAHFLSVNAFDLTTVLNASAWFLQPNYVGVNLGLRSSCVASPVMISPTLSSYFAADRGACTDTWQLATDIAGVHSVAEICAVPSTNNSYGFNIAIDPATSVMTWTATDTYYLGTIITWTPGCPIQPSLAAFQGSWVSQATGTLPR